jgi:SAM-dependent methyltransferase
MVGLAIHRHYLSGRDEAVRARIADLRMILGDLAASGAPTLEVPELDALDGYARWASIYDNSASPMFEYEQAAVRSLLDILPTGRVLDAACGTGRHLAYLHMLGHEVAGFDQCPEMLTVAKAKVPGADLRIAKLDQIPWPDCSFDTVVCALALTHEPDLAGPIRELARVVRPGGRVVISDIHPVGIIIDYQALFELSNGALGFVRNYRHLHSEYLDSFGTIGLQVRRCLEPVACLGIGLLGSQASELFSEAAAMAYLGLPMVLVWDLDRL